MKKLLFTILFLISPLLASAGYVDNFTYSPDDWKPGSDTDGAGTKLWYGGNIFTADSTQEFSQLFIRACTGSTSPETATVLVLHLKDGLSTNINSTSRAEEIGAFSFTIPRCNSNATTTYPDQISSGSYFSEVGSPIFESGQTYATVFRGDEVSKSINANFTAIENWFLGVANVTGGYGVELCNTTNSELFCGKNMYIGTGRTIIPAFSWSLSPVVVTNNCIIATIPYFDIQNCLANTFLPTQADLDEFHNLSLASTTPFGYIYDIKDLYTNFASSTGTSTVMSVSLAPFNLMGSHVFASSTFTILSAQSIKATIGQTWWDFIQSMLYGGEWLVFLSWVYVRLQTIV